MSAAGRRVQFLILALMLSLTGCAVRRTTHVSPPPLPGPTLTASVADLVKHVDEWSNKIRTLTAIVDFQPTAGSAYSGVIKEYHDVRGFILLKAPSTIRIQGQAPVVRTEIFDMVSSGGEFRLSIPPKRKFIVGKASYQGPQKSGLENLRPQHILEALLVSPIAAEGYFVEEEDQRGRPYYILTLVKPEKAVEMAIDRKIWFDRTDMTLARVEIFGAGGALVERVDYSAYQDFQGVSYPSQIRLSRPAEGYSLGIRFEKATFNQGISPEKFDLPKPANATLIELGETKPAEVPSGW